MNEIWNDILGTITEKPLWELLLIRFRKIIIETKFEYHPYHRLMRDFVCSPDCRITTLALVVLTVYVQFIGEHEHLKSTVETPRGIAVLYSKSSQSLCVPPLRSSITESAGQVSKPDLLAILPAVSIAPSQPGSNKDTLCSSLLL